MGVLDFEPELKRIKPNYFVVNRDGHTPEKEVYAVNMVWITFSSNERRQKASRKGQALKHKKKPVFPTGWRLQVAGSTSPGFRKYVPAPWSLHPFILQWISTTIPGWLPVPVMSELNYGEIQSRAEILFEMPSCCLEQKILLESNMFPGRRIILVYSSPGLASFFILGNIGLI